MKEKKWIFFRVVVYLGLAGAGLSLSILFYFTFKQYGNLRIINTISIAVAVADLLQIVFNILNVRLIHYYLFNKLLPKAIFSTWHTILLALNSCIAIAFICLFLYGFFETFKTSPYRKSPAMEDVLALVLTGTYTFVTICTITGSFVLRRYIRYYASTQEEEWLNQLGS